MKPLTTISRNPFPWDEALAFGLGILRLSPREFWAMTPRELIAARDGVYGKTRRHLSRTDLETLISAFPD